MTDQKPATSRNEKPSEGYRGALIYKQENGYKFITMFINLHAPDEQSSVTSEAYGILLQEEVDHIPAHSSLTAEEMKRVPEYSPLTATDVYHFPATDGTEITLTIKSQGAEQHARYIVHANEVEEISPFLWLDVSKADNDSLDISPRPRRDIGSDFGR